MSGLRGAWKGLDWFRPAMETRASLEHCLGVVEQNERSKLAFVGALRQQLCHDRAGASDTITAIRQRLRRLVQTVDYRLLQQNHKHPDQWFRRLGQAELGLLAPGMQPEPILASFEPIQAKALQHELKRCWQQRAATIHYFTGDEPCLWQQLLQLNTQWEQVARLPDPFADLRMEELPEGLPDELYSEALLAFLERVKGALLACRAELDELYELLWQASDPIFATLFSQACRQQRRQSAHKGAQADGVPRGGGGRWLVPAAYRHALEFFEFDDFPTDREHLKRQYRKLARRYHPDSASGDESLFRTLSQYYRELMDAMNGLADT